MNQKTLDYWHSLSKEGKQALVNLDVPFDEFQGVLRYIVTKAELPELNSDTQDFYNVLYEMQTIEKGALNEPKTT